jgi:hypothetical protein
MLASLKNAKIIIEATITRADGTVEELGEIVSNINKSDESESEE